LGVSDASIMSNGFTDTTFAANGSDGRRAQHWEAEAKKNH
jgi:hypothetical protein